MQNVENQYREVVKVEDEAEGKRIVKKHVHELIEGLRVRYTSDDISSLLVVSQNKDGEVLVNNAGTLADMRESVHAAVISYIMECGQVARAADPKECSVVPELLRLIITIGKTCMEQGMKAAKEFGPADMIALQYSAVDATMRPPSAALAELMLKMMQPPADGATEGLQDMPTAGEA